MPRRCSRIASRGLGKQEQARTQIRVEIPPHAPGLSEQLLASPGRLCHVSTPTLTRVPALECAGVCPRWAQIWAHTQPREISAWATCWKQWWAGTGLNRRHKDFQFSTSIDGIARLLS